MCARDSFPSARQRGFSLIELMVGLVVAMAVSLAAASAAMSLGAAQRQGVGTGLAVAGAATTFSALKGDIAQAGLGFFGDGALLCERLNLSVGSRDLSLKSFAPLQATRGADSDRVELIYADNVAGGANVLLRSVSGGLDARLESFLPASTGQAVLMAPAPGAADPACTVRSLTSQDAATADAPQLLRFGPSGLHNGVTFTAPAAYGPRDRVALLGGLKWHRYFLEAGQLKLEQPLSGGKPSTVLSNVVALRVQYGVAGVSGGGVAEWVDPVKEWAALDPSHAQRVKAVRLGLVVRSAHAEKASPGAGCKASEAMPRLFGAEISLAGEWRCFRYRSEEAVVPLRNYVVGLHS